MDTQITELLGIRYPILQGGMAWVAEHHLAAAVSEAGGLGLIGASAAPAEWVRNEIREAKKLTDKPFVTVGLFSPQMKIAMCSLQPVPQLLQHTQQSHRVSSPAQCHQHSLARKQ